MLLEAREAVWVDDDMVSAWQLMYCLPFAVLVVGQHRKGGQKVFMIQVAKAAFQKWP